MLTLYYLNDLSVKDIAGTLGISEGAVKQRLGPRAARNSGRPMRAGAGKGGGASWEKMT